MRKLGEVSGRKDHDKDKSLRPWRKLRELSGRKDRDKGKSLRPWRKLVELRGRKDHDKGKSLRRGRQQYGPPGLPGGPFFRPSFIFLRKTCYIPFNAVLSIFPLAFRGILSRYIILPGSIYSGISWESLSRSSFCSYFSPS